MPPRPTSCSMTHGPSRTPIMMGGACAKGEDEVGDSIAERARNGEPEEGRAKSQAEALPTDIGPTADRTTVRGQGLRLRFSGGPSHVLRRRPPLSLTPATR